MADAAGAILLRAGVLTPQALAQAAALKHQAGGTLGEALVHLGLIDEERLVSVFQQSLLVPYVTKSEIQRIPRQVLQLVPATLAAECRVVPTEVDAEGNLTLAMADPTDNAAVDRVAAHTGRFVMRAVAAPTAIRYALLTYYNVVLPALTRPPGSEEAAGEAAQQAGEAPRGKQKSGPRGEPGRRNTLPPSARVVPDASIPPERAPGTVLMALAKAVASDRPEDQAAKGGKKVAGQSSQAGKRTTGRHKAVQGQGSGKRAAVKGAAADPILLDRPTRAGTPGTTLPGVGSPVEELLTKVEQLRAAGSRDEVIALLLDYSSMLAHRVGLFVVQKGQLVCLDGRGPDHVVVAMKWFTIPVDTPSPFRDVLNSRKHYIGTLTDNAESRAFRNALGSTSGDLLLLPLMVGDRAVGVLYADEIHADLGKLSQELETLSREAGSAFARIILSKKHSSS